MSPTLRVVTRLALLAALLVVPSVVIAQEESPGSPGMTDNPCLDHNLYGGDAGSPWPVSIRTGPGPGAWTQSIPPAPASPAAVLWLEPVFAHLPGSLPRVFWLPLDGSWGGVGGGPLPGGRAEPLPD